MGLAILAICLFDRTYHLSYVEALLLTRMLVSLHQTVMNKNLKKVLITVLIFGFICSLSIPEMIAQCPMCKMTAESNLKNGGSSGQGLNAGILFILSLPYLIVGSIGYAWWRNNKQYDLEELDS